MLDKNRIKEDADCLVVAEYLNIPITRRGNRNLILCPNHADRKIGSCYLTSQGYYCYSCHGKGNVIDLVMRTQDVPFQDALEIIADICGGRENYRVCEREERRSHCLPYQYQKLIGLENEPVYADLFFPTTAECDAYLEDHPNAFLKETCLEHDDQDVETPDMALADPPKPAAPPHLLGYVVRELRCASPLAHLYSTSRTEYYRLVRAYCLNAIDSAKNLYEAVIASSKDPIRCMGSYQKKLNELNYVLETYCTDPNDAESLDKPSVAANDVAAWGQALSQSLLRMGAPF